MAVDYGRFVEIATAAGLITGESLSRAERALAESQHSGDVGELAKVLVQQGVLTKYQAAAAYQDKIDTLLLGNYLVLDRLGAGGMGQVFRARHRKMDRIVALKVLPKKAVASPEAVERFHREVRAAARLIHSNIVTALDADEGQGTHFLVMEYVEGHDLSSIVKERGPLPVDEAVRYLADAARGLEHAHSEGIVHRDIKPSNLIVDKRGTVKILDMGLARFVDPVAGQEVAAGQATAAAAGLTQQGSVMGTVDYMAPEQAMDTRQADARADLYSLGCTLHYLLTGRPPFAGDTLLKRLLAHRDGAIPSLRAANPQVPEALDAVFQRLLAKRPDERFGSAAELISALGSIGANSTRDPTTNPRRIPMMAAAAAAGVAALAIGSWWLVDSAASHDPTLEQPSMAAIQPVADGAAVAEPVTAISHKSDELPLNASAPSVAATAAPSVATSAAPSTTTAEPHSDPPASQQPPGNSVATIANPPEAMKPASSPPAAAIVEIEPTAAKQPAPSAERKPPEPSERALAQPIEKRPVPATDAQTKAQELVKDIFRDELAGAKTTEAKEALIAKLLDQSTIGSGEPAECYAMISQARDLAIEAGDPTAAQRAIAKLDEWFAIDACEELTGALARMADKSLLPAPSYKALAELAIAESDHAVALEHWDAAKRLSDISLTAVRKSKDAALTRQAVDHSKSIAAGRAQWEAAQKALDTLERNPDDPAANLVVGRYRCFVQSDWAGGLKYLAASGDSHLQELAAKSIAVGNDPLTVAELGDAWWDAAERAKSKDKVELRQGAAHWYAAALEGLSGLARTRVEKRLAELSAPAANATVKKTPAPARPSPPSKNALAANGLTIPNVLDCSSQIFVFDPGPTFDSGKSWTLRFEFMAGSSEKLDRTLAWYGDQVGSVIAIKYRTDSVEARAGYGTSEQMMVSGPLTPTNQPKWVPLVFKFDAAANELVLFLNNEQVAKNHAIKTKADRPLRFYVGGRPDRPEQFPGLIRAVWFGN